MTNPNMMMDKLPPVGTNPGPTHSVPSHSSPGKPLGKNNLRRRQPASEDAPAHERQGPHSVPGVGHRSPAKPLGEGVKASNLAKPLGEGVKAQAPALLGMLLLALALLGAGCQSGASMQKVDATQLAALNILVLPTQPVMGGLAPGKGADLVAEFYRQLEQEGLGAKLLRLDADTEKTLSAQVWGQIGLYAATLTEVGISEPVMASAIAQATHTNYLMAVHFVYLPCDGCLEGPRLGLIGQIIQASDGQPVWRAHVAKRVDTMDPSDWEAAARGLKDDLWHDARLGLTPKWHKLRFKALAAHHPAVTPPAAK